MSRGRSILALSTAAAAPLSPWQRRDADRRIRGRLVEPRTVDPGTGKLCSRQIGAEETRIAQVGAAKVSPAQRRVAQVGTGEKRTRRGYPGQALTAQIKVDQICSGQ